MQDIMIGIFSLSLFLVACFFVFTEKVEEEKRVVSRDVEFLEKKVRFIRKEIFRSDFVVKKETDKAVSLYDDENS